MRKTFPIGVVRLFDLREKAEVGTDSMPPWLSRFVPDWLWGLFPAYLRLRLLLLAECADRWSCESITRVKIYLGHSATAASVAGLGTAVGVGLLVSGLINIPTLALITALSGAAGMLWWVIAEILDTIQFGFSIDSIYDGLEYSIGAFSFIGAGLFGVLGVLAAIPSALIWFHLLPKRVIYG